MLHMDFYSKTGILKQVVPTYIIIYVVVRIDAGAITTLGFGSWNDPCKTETCQVRKNKYIYITYITNAYNLFSIHKPEGIPQNMECLSYQFQAFIKKCPIQITFELIF